MTDHRKWQYYIICDNHLSILTVKELNQLGEQGWELVSAAPYAQTTAPGNFYMQYTFKREVKHG